MEFVRLWFYGYSRPQALVDGLLARRGYWSGLGAQALRATLDSLLIYLPVAIAGRVPPQEPLLPIAPERYYLFLVFSTIPILLAEMLLGATTIHVILRALRRDSDLGVIVNLLGMSALVVGALIVLWDWMWFAIGYYDQYFLGISHLFLSLWSVFIVCLGLKRRFGVSVRLGIALNFASMVAALTLAVTLMRSPF
ncbi:MAG: hypothetical protein HZB44_07650 [Actinobacteria bacterium]|nr:hypothetical protein [Actinomycetota bacterium]